MPPPRVTESRPFSHCGIDFCGPVSTYLRIRGKAPYKTYIAIFVSFVTKCIHIEVVSDLSTEAFIAALKRFISRRGLPSDIYCDNATNFVGACNKMAELKSFIFDANTKDAVFNYCLNNFINFHFIPTRAPHFGGLWEAAVNSAKGLLIRSFANTRLTYEELTTAMIENVAVLNSRPLFSMSTDPSDLRDLTPAHFLVGTSLKALPERYIPSKFPTLTNKWTQITAVKQQFWQQWREHYLHELQARPNWHTPSPDIKPDIYP